MSTTSELSKLVELRAKTDRQLVAFITHRLDAGLNLAQSDLHRTQACEAYAEALRLLPVIANVSKSQKRALEAKMDRLSKLLSNCSTTATLRVQAACS